MADAARRVARAARLHEDLGRVDRRGSGDRPGRRGCQGHERIGVGADVQGGAGSGKDDAGRGVVEDARTVAEPRERLVADPHGRLALQHEHQSLLGCAGPPDRRTWLQSVGGEPDVRPARIVRGDAHDRAVLPGWSRTTEEPPAVRRGRLACGGGPAHRGPRLRRRTAGPVAVNDCNERIDTATGDGIVREQMDAIVCIDVVSASVPAHRALPTQSP